MRHSFVPPLALAVLAVSASPAAAGVGPLAQARTLSPFAPNCHGAPQSGTLYANAELEPWVDVDPTAPRRLIGVYQQDRFSSGGASGTATSTSTDGGATWAPVPLADLPKFSRCAGSAPGSAGDYERATDPWVSFAPDGTAYQMALSFNDNRDFANAMLVSRSYDGGLSWDTPAELIVDTDPNVFNDKNSITADPHDANFVYAIWDRLVFPVERAGGVSHFTAAAHRGPTFFTRTTNGGASWEPARNIFDPGQNDSTIANQIAVTGRDRVTGESALVNVMAVFRNDAKTKRRGATISVLRSTDRGRNWSGEIVVDQLGTVGIRDPRDGAWVRTGDIIPSIATDERPGHDEVYAVWQDARWNGFERDQIAFASSQNGGRTWSPAVRINGDATTQAFTPAIRVDDAGNIGVVYYDFRNDTAVSPTLDTDVWVLRSIDGGSTWREERVTPAPFDMTKAPMAGGYFVGDYIGLAATGSSFTPFFSASSNAGTDTFGTTYSEPFGGTVVVPEPAPSGLSAQQFPEQRGKPTPR